MEYLYYPGCSLECSGKQYDESLRAVFRALDIKLTELDDWNCCGATIYMSVNEETSLAIAARNLALAEKEAPATSSPPAALAIPFSSRPTAFCVRAPNCGRK
jgi:heterodisulfide reductase subunit B2